MIRVYILSLLLVWFVGCSQKQAIIEPVSDGYQVKVTSNGRVVDDFEQRLVHRVDLPKQSALQMHQAIRQRKSLPFRANIERNLQGSISGARLQPPNSRVFELLGLLPQDLVTAVGKTQIRSLGDLQLLFSSLADSNEVSMTFIRKGRAHKLLYRVVN